MKPQMSVKRLLLAGINSSEATHEDWHPSHEQLAELIDGKLKGKEKRRVITHMNSCGECYSLFIESYGDIHKTSFRDRLQVNRKLLLYAAMFIAAAFVSFGIIGTNPVFHPDRGATEALIKFSGNTLILEAGKMNGVLRGTISSNSGKTVRDKRELDSIIEEFRASGIEVPSDINAINFENMDNSDSGLPSGSDVKMRVEDGVLYLSNHE